MKYVKRLSFLSVSVLLLFSPFPGSADELQEGKKYVTSKNESQSKETVATQSEKTVPPVKMPVYNPPRRGAPDGRVSGASRTPGEGAVTLLVLAPDHTGLTVREQPDLYWYLSGSTSYPIVLTLSGDEDTKPLLEILIDSPPQPGIQRIRLADYNVRLEPGIEYQWFVAVVVDREKRSKDILAGGLIERVELSPELRATLVQSPKQLAPEIYAAAGIWYEAISGVSELVDASPKDPVLRRQRASLLEQVGLSEVATSDKQFTRAD